MDDLLKRLLAYRSMSETQFNNMVTEYKNTLAAAQVVADNTSDIFKYQQLDLTTATLDEVKQAKMAELNEQCNQTIIAGFDYTVNNVSYHFSCSIPAQTNFQGTNALFKDGLITTVDWTVINNSTGLIERITMDQPTFDGLRMTLFNHISSQVSRLRDTLAAQVNSATTIDEVDAVVW
jgi:hypothetical protein